MRIALILAVLLATLAGAAVANKTTAMTDKRRFISNEHTGKRPNCLAPDDVFERTLTDLTQTYRPHPLDARLAAALPAGSLFAVGGRVRDELRDAGDAVPHDLDYVVAGIPLERVSAALAAIGRVDLVGASFAVIKLTLDGTTVDIALPRRERSTGAGHREFAVECGPEIPLEDDLGRRDFRMNMIARALPGGQLVDPHHGAADIAAKRISILTPRTFDEDPLRLLRAAQFAARFGYTATAETIAAMRAAAPLVATVSAERSALPSSTSST